MPNGKRYEVIVAIEKDGRTEYARLCTARGDRTMWSKRTAEKHAREFKANHMRDAWAQEVE